MSELQARTRDLDRADLSARRLDFDAIPVIDIDGLYSQDLRDRRRVAAEIDRACSQIGFMYVRNHHIPMEKFARCFDVVRDFFSLPLAEKMRYDIHRVGRHRGYVPVGGLNADPHKPGADLQEGYEIGLELGEDDPEYRAGHIMYGPNVWPERPADFAPILYDWFEECIALGRVLFRGFALALEVPEDFFEDKVNRSMSQLRAIYYPEQPPAEQAAGNIGVGAHSDYECFTILAQSAEGLQVRNRQGEWIAAPPIDGALVINIGDMMERWTNDHFISTVHRVVNNSGNERFSLPFFFGTNHDTVVECLSSCQGPDNPPRYPPTHAGEWTTRNVRAAYTYEPGIRR